MKRALVLPLLVFACLAQGYAASDIVYVAYNGADTHPCTRVAPCKTITHALTVVNAGGQVIIVGSGTYDTFTITQAVTVAAEAGVIAILDVPNGGVGIDIKAGASDHVVIRGLNLNGQGDELGISVESAGEVSLEDCIVRNFDSALYATSTVATFITVKGGVYAAGPNGGNGVSMVLCCTHEQNIIPPTVAIDGVTIEDGCVGVIGDAAVLTITNSLVSGGTTTNASCEQSLGFGTIGIEPPVIGTMVVENSVISNYSIGLGAGGDLSSYFYLSSNTITGNAIGVENTGAFGPSNGFTRGNNTIEGNGQNISGTLTLFSGQ